ncbi:hypothetical protein [Winogradskyella flava]|uniref:hypothetical protein n=1 Tax=Winogradskyella flava TaxID=1884876 RepID=UPI0024924B93|nr:hypothetical protein [Winogradskyella flava]
MKIAKNTNFLFFGLTLLLSLVSFSGFANQLPVEATKTTLVVKGTAQDFSRSILFKAINKGAVVLDNMFSEHSFTMLLTIQNLHDLSYFKTYTHKTLELRTAQLQTKLYTFCTHQTLYSDIV